MKTLITLLVVIVAVAITWEPPSPDDGFNPSAVPSAITDADFYEEGLTADAQVELGRLLFFDKILSGNKNIAFLEFVILDVY